MRKFILLTAFLLVFAPITGHATQLERISTVTKKSVEAASGDEDTYVVDQSVELEKVKVKPPFAKENVKGIFSAAKSYEKNELIIKFADTVSEDKKELILDELSLKLVSTMENTSYSLVESNENTNIQEIAKKLVGYKEVEYVEPNVKMALSYVPKDPGYASQWHLPKINAPKAWDATKGSTNVVVAVIDDGVQKDHPDLKHSIVSPYNMVNGTTNYIPGDHGTHVAGIIASAMNDSGTVGIASRTKIMPINVFNGEKADMFTVAKAIEYATQKGADIINLSLGSYSHISAVDYAIQYAASKGTTVIAASGNDKVSKTTYPAAYKNVIAVSATTPNDQIANFSNYGSYIDVSAPGTSILSTTANSTHKYMEGTSMAAPVVSGVAALILAKNPFLTGTEVERALKKSALDLGSKGSDIYYGSGRVDAYKALLSTPTPISNLTGPSSLLVNGKNKATFTFGAPKNTALTVVIRNSAGTTVRNLIKNKKWAGGKASVSWDGKLSSGSFAGNGKYTAVVYVSNSKGKVHASKAINVQTNMATKISVTSSVFYSPVAKGKLSLPVTFNKPVKVTARIVDGKNKAIKTLMSGVSVSAGTKNVIWDGKGSTGKSVVDGTYKLLITAADSQKKTATATSVITLDRKAPLASVSAAPSVFKVDGKTTSTASFKSNETGYITAYVRTDKGVNVRILTTNKLYSAGSRSFKWDGKNNKGGFVSNGNYQYIFEVKDRAGNKSTVKSPFFKLENTSAPTITALKEVTFPSDKPLTVPYTLSKAGVVSIHIEKDGQIVKQISTNETKAAGANSFTWDGRNAWNSNVPDGKYSFVISAIDDRNAKSQHRGIITVSISTTKVDVPKLVWYQPNAEVPAEVFYRVSQQSQARVEVLDKQKNVIRVIQYDSTVPKGINKFTWDGRNASGYKEYGSEYFFRITVTSPRGVKTIAEGSMSSITDPPWLKVNDYERIRSKTSPYDIIAINFLVTVTQPVKMEVQAFENRDNNKVLAKKTYSLKSGKNTAYFKKPKTAYLYYFIEYTDDLGNTYQYQAHG